MIGIIGAMDEEIKEILEGATIQETKVKASMVFNKGILEGREIVIVRCGIGKVNAACCTQILVCDYHVDYIINTGIAGSLKNEIDIADIVLSSDVLHHDMDATGFGYELGQIPRMETKSFMADKRLIDIANACASRIFDDTKVFVGRIVSGDQFVSDSKRKEFIVKNFEGFCTEMEGASIGQAAYLNNVPFLIIRAISDKADNSATMDYGEFEKIAIGKLAGLVREIVKEV